MKFKTAVASSDGKIINQHFGRAELFGIFELDTDSGMYRHMESRETEPLCSGFSHDTKILNSISILLGDCEYVLVQRVGDCAVSFFRSRGIRILESPESIPEAFEKLIHYHSSTHV